MSNLVLKRRGQVKHTRFQTSESIQSPGKDTILNDISICWNSCEIQKMGWLGTRFCPLLQGDSHAFEPIFHLRPWHKHRAESRIRFFRSIIRWPTNSSSIPNILLQPLVSRRAHDAQRRNESRVLVRQHRLATIAIAFSSCGWRRQLHHLLHRRRGRAVRELDVERELRADGDLARRVKIGHIHDEWVPILVGCDVKQDRPYDRNRWVDLNGSFGYGSRRPHCDREGLEYIIFFWRIRQSCASCMQICAQTKRHSWFFSRVIIGSRKSPRRAGSLSVF